MSSVTSSPVPNATRSPTSFLAGPDRVVCAVLAAAGLVVYFITALVLEARGGTTHFGADAHLYAPLASGIVNDRMARFHPVTVGLAVAWMQVLNPLTGWIAPHHLLKALFALFGAVGAGAAYIAFSTIMARGEAALWASIYALSFGVWYFAGIVESKIVTATLCTIYVAIYLQLRERWSLSGAAGLTAILLVACLNEITCAALVVVPAVDTLLRRGWDWREGRWIGAHALAGPLALILLETVVNGWLVAPTQQQEGMSHLSMLLYYIARNTHDLATLYAFTANWLFFNLAAPSATAPLWDMPPMRGYFEPSMMNYLRAPASAALAAAACAVAVLAVLSRTRRALPAGSGALLAALGAWSLVRAAFFFLFNPAEPLLFSPAVTLSHLLIVAIPLAAVTLPVKRPLLAAVAVLLLIVNGAFMVG